MQLRQQYAIIIKNDRQSKGTPFDKRLFFYSSTKRALDQLLCVRSDLVETDRRKEVVDICLDLFVEKGLYKTSTSDLSNALQLQSGGLYYYFQTKDDAVVACVEAAIRRLEDALISPVRKEIINPVI